MSNDNEPALASPVISKSARKSKKKDQKGRAKKKAKKTKKLSRTSPYTENRQNSSVVNVDSDYADAQPSISQKSLSQSFDPFDFNDELSNDSTPKVVESAEPSEERATSELKLAKDGALEGESDGLFFSSNFDEQAVTVLHGESLLARRTRRPPARTTWRRKDYKHAASQQHPSTIDETWKRYLHRLATSSPDFFSSAEAGLRLSAPAIAGKPAYSALQLNENNSEDIREVWKLEFEPKLSSGGSNGTFRQFCLVAGQLLRLSVVRDVSVAAEAHRSGQLFTAVCDFKTVDLLINHYRARAICTTVMTKAMHLKKLAEHAYLHFTGKDEGLKGQAERSRLHLRAVFNIQKALGRDRAARKTDFDSRLANATVFMPRDFTACKGRAKAQLDSLMSGFLQAKREGGIELAQKWIRERSVTQKWCINFLVLLVLVGGGQRPQVYSQLQVATDNELEELRHTARREGFIELRTVKEKTSRSRFMPFVLVPASILKYLEFHQKYIRPGILETLEYDEMECSTFPVLLDTRTAQQLTTAQVTRTFQKFLKGYDPELAGLTIMNIRSSYGTMLMRAYREKRVFVGVSEGEFLDQLARQMNTSSEQLRATYIGVDRADHETSSRRLMEALAATVGEDEDDTVHDDGDSGDLVREFLS